MSWYVRSLSPGDVHTQMFENPSRSGFGVSC
jgi:hypothetical protein